MHLIYISITNNAVHLIDILSTIIHYLLNVHIPSPTALEIYTQICVF